MAQTQQAPSTIFPQSHVGFDSITSQIEKKLLKRGFQFNVICVGTFPADSLSWFPSPFIESKPKIRVHLDSTNVDDFNWHRCGLVFNMTLHSHHSTTDTAC